MRKSESLGLMTKVFRQSGRGVQGQPRGTLGWGGGGGVKSLKGFKGKVAFQKTAICKTASAPTLVSLLASQRSFQHGCENKLLAPDPEGLWARLRSQACLSVAGRPLAIILILGLLI